jgi:hypothetical protein
MVGGVNDTVKKRPAKKQPRHREPPLNLSGIKFEDALKKMLNTSSPKKTSDVERHSG